MLANDFRRELNPAQVEAVLQTEGPLLVFAGAGSGKTRVITFRAAHIVSSLGIPPWRVMCVTFTNKATGEMKSRLTHLLGEQAASDLWVATFHSTGARLLRRYHDRIGRARNFAIYDDADQRSLMARVLKDLGISDELLNARAALGAIDKFKQEVLSPRGVADQAEGEHQRRLAEVYANYEHQLAHNNAVDFGDLLKLLVELLEGHEDVRTELQHRFQYIMIDEFQDTNAAQYRIVRALVGPEKNLCVVGDDDQAIYRWRGADVRNILYFRRDFPDAKVVKLEQNYRSTGRILRAANAVIQRLHGRESKVLFTQNGEGNAIEVLPTRDEREEAMKIASRISAARSRGATLRDIAVFYRINAQSRPLEEAMRTHNLPYVVVGGQRFYERAEVKDVLAYLRLCVNPNDDVSLLRVINQPPRGIGATTIERVLARSKERASSVWKILASGDYGSDLTAAPRKKLADFYALVTDLRRSAGTLAQKPGELAAEILYRTGYTAMLQADKTPESEARVENLRELVGSMEEYTREQEQPSVEDYLERVTLSQSDEGEAEGAVDRVALMTVHSAKGLEFDTVFVTGLEEGMFPYKGVGPGASSEELEEERRLAYVAITRARKQLVLSFAQFRQIFGNTKVSGPSRFLLEIPEEILTQPVRRLSMRTGGEFGGSDSQRQFGGGGYGGGGSYGGGSTSGRGSVPPGVGTFASRSGAARSDEGGAQEPSGTRVEYDAVEVRGATNAQGFRKGMRVKHPKWGVGRVDAVEPGAELKVMVYFPGLGTTKKVLAEFLQPL